MESVVVDPEVLVEKDAIVGEGAIWDEGTQQLYWLDILSHEVYVYNPAQGTNRVIPTCQAVGTVVVRKGGGLVVALHNGFAHLDLETAGRGDREDHAFGGGSGALDTCQPLQ